MLPSPIYCKFVIYKLCFYATNSSLSTDQEIKGLGTELL